MTMENCPFCQIIARALPADILYEDDEAIAIQDLHPLAPIHILIIPKEHIPSLNSVHEDQTDLLSHLFFVARKIAYEKGIGEDGYRCVINTGTKGGQTVFHLHLHLLGGAPVPPELLTKGLH